MKIKNIAKFGSKLVLFMIVVFSMLMIKSMFFGLTTETHAQSIFDPLTEIEEETQLPTFQDPHVKAGTQTGVNTFTSVIYTVLDFIKLALGGITIIVIIYEVIKIISARKNIEDVRQKAKDHFIFIGIAVIIVLLADTIVRTFFGVEGEVFSSPQAAQQAAEQGVVEINKVIDIVFTIAGSLAIIMVVLTAMQLIVSSGNEDVQTKVKKRMGWLIGGLVILGISRYAIFEVLYPSSGQEIVNIDKFTLVVVRLTNFLSGFIVIGAILAFIYGGIIYVTSVGDDNKTGKAKKVFIGAIIALLIALAAFAIVNTVMKLEPGV